MVVQGERVEADKEQSHECAAKSLLRVVNGEGRATWRAGR